MTREDRCPDLRSCRLPWPAVSLTSTWCRITPSTATHKNTSTLDASGQEKVHCNQIPGGRHPPPELYFEQILRRTAIITSMPTLCLEQFWASEVALSLACLTHNLIMLFERHLGWQQEGHPAQPVVLAVRNGGRTESSRQQDHPRTGRATPQTRLVATLLGGTLIHIPQLRCRGKPTGSHRMKPARH